MLSAEAAGRAGTFVYRTARLLERRRFEYLFRSGSAAAVLGALAAYRNADGGYGNALEPDGRGPGSQPITTLSALHVLFEAGAAPDGVVEYLESVTALDGGLPFVHPNAAEFPRAPWWRVADRYGGELLTTANLVAALWRAGVVHPWVDRAAQFCWAGVDAITETHPYEAMGVVRFLDRAPDRDRAAAAAERIGALVRAAGYVRLGTGGVTPPGYADGELQDPHDYAPTPSSLARAWFTDEEFESSLDSVVDAQGEDGGWRVRWPAWAPVTEFEWAGVVTVENLVLLRDFGRWDPDVY
ncbi:hypothetical protein [Actinokineospora spheciospongiae]|uniref:hypothetical protein n=1 Tax=Actinokineospora spheciospongiae TaxID=909613 RepID=UPI000D7159E9|nr:hypothetical protein [Actinokineospora spheciospongiae]PWW62420.1 hypothetical protein DFQ13_105234 [Actinokineospora spheciospongiae]